MNPEVKLMAHRVPIWPECYRVHLAKDGRELGMGRHPLKLAAVRLVEEGLGHAGTVMRMRFVDGTETVATITEAREGVSL